MNAHFFRQDGAYIVYIYSGAAANMDKRLQVFDKITEIEGKKITSEMSNEDLKKLFKRRYIMVREEWMCSALTSILYTYDYYYQILF